MWQELLRERQSVGERGSFWNREVRADVVVRVEQDLKAKMTMAWGPKEASKQTAPGQTKNRRRVNAANGPHGTVHMERSTRNGEDRASE